MFSLLTAVHRTPYPQSVLADNLPRSLLTGNTGDAVERDFGTRVESLLAVVNLFSVLVYQRTVNLARRTTIPTVVFIFG